MSQAEELLNSVSEEVPMHTHPVPDTDTYFVIDPITRRIENTNRKKNVVMQYDHNSERFTFELPRYIDGHDMLECTSVTVNVDNIEVVESGEDEEVVEPCVNSDAPDMTDLRVHPTDPEKVICSWLISRNSTQLAGILSFHVEFKCVDSNGNVVYEWSTDNYDEIEVRARKKNGEAAVVEHTDLLEQWRTRIFGAGDSVMANIAAEGEAQVAAVKLEATELLESVQTKAGAIVCETFGESMAIRDSSDDHIRGLKLFGKSSQDGEPTPDNPVEIVSVENPNVSVHGKNLIPFPYTDTSMTKNGITFTVNDDKSIRLTGTATNVSVFTVYQGELPLNGVFTLSGVTNDVVPSTHYMQPYIDGIFKDAQIDGGRTYEINGNLTQISLYVKSGETVDCMVYPQLEIGEEATEYEPPTTQRVVIRHTLSGIPVTSGGNYTDSDGQQWICDEIDLERGVYIQRTKLKTLYDRTNWFTWGADLETEGQIGFYTYCEDLANRKCISNSFKYAFYAWGGKECGIGAYDSPESSYIVVSIPTSYLEDVSTDEAAAASFIKYISQTNANVLVCIPPIETPLTAEEIAAFKTLRTNHPNTTILNDAGAWMSVKYNADTKSYVDNPKTLKLVDSSTGVVYELKIVNGSLTVNPV